MMANMSIAFAQAGLVWAVRDGRSMLDVAIAGIKSSLIFRRCHPRLTMGLIIDHSRFSPLVGAKVE
jgi:hypothetical protein